MMKPEAQARIVHRSAGQHRFLACASAFNDFDYFAQKVSVAPDHVGFQFPRLESRPCAAAYSSRRRVCGSWRSEISDFESEISDPVRFGSEASEGSCEDPEVASLVRKRIVGRGPPPIQPVWFDLLFDN